MQRTSIYFGLLLIAIFATMVSRLRSEIIISEIMYDPQGSDVDTSVTPNVNREWAEIYNTGSTSIDISGWQFGDSQDNNWASPFPAGTTIGSHQALVVTGDSASFTKEWGASISRIPVTGFPS